MVLCTPDCGISEERAYWTCLLDHMTVGRIELHGGPMYVPQYRQETMPAPE